jgi:hypothetical protein
VEECGKVNDFPMKEVKMHKMTKDQKGNHPIFNVRCGNPWDWYEVHPIPNWCTPEPPTRESPDWQYATQEPLVLEPKSAFEKAPNVKRKWNNLKSLVKAKLAAQGTGGRQEQLASIHSSYVTVVPVPVCVNHPAPSPDNWALNGIGLAPTCTAPPAVREWIYKWALTIATIPSNSELERVPARYNQLIELYKRSVATLLRLVTEMMGPETIPATAAGGSEAQQTPASAGNPATAGDGEAPQTTEVDARPNKQVRSFTITCHVMYDQFTQCLTLTTAAGVVTQGTPQ